MAARTNPDASPVSRWGRLAGLAVAGGAALWFFPLWHVVPLAAPASAGAGAGALDLPAFAEKFWGEKLQLSRSRAVEAAIVVAALRRDAAAAVTAHAHTVGLGGLAYYYVRGEGRVVARDKNVLLLAFDGDPAPVVAIQIGAIFGNAVRDGTGLLNMNDFPSLTEYNALAAELNRLVEARVLPGLRDKAQVGARIAFAGCAEAADPVAGRPLVSLVPVYAEVR
jgi:predicted lipoprotein